MAVTHPVANEYWSEINAHIAFLKNAALTYWLYVLFTTPIEGDSFWTFNGVYLSKAWLAPFIVYADYWHEDYTAKTRPDTPYFGWMDFLGSLAVVLVIILAAASWVPSVAQKFTGWGWPVALFNELTLPPLVLFFLASCRDIYVNHIMRPHRKHAAEESGESEEPLQFKFTQDTIDRLGEAFGNVVADRLEPTLKKIADKHT